MQYEGLEQSPNIFYTGATTNQQIVPGAGLPQGAGQEAVYLVGSDYVFPRTANKIIKAYAEANGMTVLGEDYAPLGSTEFSTIVNKVKASKADAVFNTLNGDSNVAFFKEYKSAGLTADEHAGGLGVDRRGRGQAASAPQYLAGQLTAWNYYQTTDGRGEQEVRRGVQGEVRRGQADQRPDGGRATSSVYLWKAMVEKAGSFDVEKVRAASDGITFDAPEGMVTVDGETQHIYKTARIGKIGADGLITRCGTPASRSSRTRTSRATPGRPACPDDPAAGGAALAPLQAGPTPFGGARMTVILGQTFTGISIGAVLLLIALGLALTFGQMNVINMAHGEFIMAGAYTTYVLQQADHRRRRCRCSSRCRSPSLVAGAMGVLLEWLLIRRLYARPLDTLLVTWGVSLMLQQLARDIFGAPNVQTRAPDLLTGNITLIGGDDR